MAGAPSVTKTKQSNVSATLIRVMFDPRSPDSRQRDNAVVDDMRLEVVTRRAPSNAELRDLAFAFRVAKHVKSNAIVYARDCATVGVGLVVGPV